MISESDIIRFLRRWGDSFVDVTDFLANSVSNSLQKSSAIQKNFCNFTLGNHDIITSLFTARLLNISDITKRIDSFFKVADSFFYAFF